MDNFIIICGRKYELIYTVSAMEKIEEMIGNEKGGLQKWLTTAPSVATTMKRAASMLTILANAKAEKDAVATKAGLFSEEPQPYIDKDALKCILTPGDVAKMQKVMIQVVTDGFKANIPEEIESKRDYDLEEIEEKNA